MYMIVFYLGMIAYDISPFEYTMVWLWPWLTDESNWNKFSYGWWTLRWNYGNLEMHVPEIHLTLISNCIPYKNIERYTADTIVSWPNPKQWGIVHTSDLMLIIRQIYIYIYMLSMITREMGKLKTYNPTYCIMDNGEYMLILLTHSTKYIWQAFYKFNAFRQVCTMMVMRLCTV